MEPRFRARLLSAYLIQIGKQKEYSVTEEVANQSERPVGDQAMLISDIADIIENVTFAEIGVFIDILQDQGWICKMTEAVSFEDVEKVKQILQSKVLPGGKALNRTTDPCLFAIYLEERLNGGFSASFSEVKDCLTDFDWDLTNLNSAIDALKNKQFVETKKFSKGNSFTSLTNVGEQEISRLIQSIAF